MAIIDIDRMYDEMKNTMQSNFRGNSESRFKQAKKMFIESVMEIIDANKYELLKEMEEERWNQKRRTLKKNTPLTKK